MDTELARTFLTVVSAGNFVRAAERLHVTQSTVSARIQTLETQLGTRLFVRNKGGTYLTSFGQRFERHALALVKTVAQLRQEVGVSESYRSTLTIGARFGLWDQLLSCWLPVIREKAPDLAVRAEIGFEPDLMQGLIDARLDIGLMYTPQSRPGLIIDPLLVEKLILVSTRRDYGTELDSSYVYVDWGPEFYDKHRASFPEFEGPALTVAIGRLGLDHILSYGGSGYFPERLVQSYLRDANLHRIEGAVAFDLPAYLVYSNRQDDRFLNTAVKSIKQMVISSAENVSGSAQ